MKRAPQEYLRSGRVFVTCDADESTLECVVRLCGEDVVLYASDYPHWDSRSTLCRRFEIDKDYLESAKEKILSGNAYRLFASLL
jgi:predicted TIM-barrel fold metal-dependent hydrolase